MTNQTWGGASSESGWSRLSGRQKTSVIVAGALVLCLCVLTLIGALAGGETGKPAVSPSTTTARATSSRG